MMYSAYKCDLRRMQPSVWEMANSRRSLVSVIQWFIHKEIHLCPCKRINVFERIGWLNDSKIHSLVNGH